MPLNEPAISIAIITPTIGRSSLRQAFESAIHQMGAADEWWVVGDGRRPTARAVVKSFGDSRLRYCEHYDRASRYGNAQRNFAMSRAMADYFVFLDDDDVLLPRALDAIRRE